MSYQKRNNKKVIIKMLISQANSQAYVKLLYIFLRQIGIMQVSMILFYGIQLIFTHFNQFLCADKMEGNGNLACKVVLR